MGDEIICILWSGPCRTSLRPSKGRGLLTDARPFSSFVVLVPSQQVFDRMSFRNPASSSVHDTVGTQGGRVRPFE